MNMIEIRTMLRCDNPQHVHFALEDHDKDDMNFAMGKGMKRRYWYGPPSDHAMACYIEELIFMPRTWHTNRIV